jgi:hypothetical protein
LILSFKELKAYSGILAVAFLSLALLVQPPAFQRFPELTGLIHQGGIWPLLPLFLVVFLSYIAVRAGWYVEAMISNPEWSVVFILTFVAFGLSILCKGKPEDPFPLVHDFWRYGSLAFGLTLLGKTDPDSTPAGKATEVRELANKEIAVVPPPESLPLNTEPMGSLYVPPPSWKDDEIEEQISPPPSC